MAAAAFAITSDRSKYIEFTKPYFDAGKALLVYKEEKVALRSSFDIFAFLDPFDIFTKLAIVCSLIAASVAYLILCKINPYSLNSNRRSEESVSHGSFWFLYTAAMQQGPDNITSISGKILVGGWFFFCLVIIATYTANLAAFLTVNSFADGIDSLEDLEKQTVVRYGTVEDSSVIEFFNHSSYKALKTLVESTEEAYERVENPAESPYVFIWDEPILSYRASHDPCKSQVVGEPFNFEGYGLALPLNMPYASDFSLAVLKLRESGKLDEIREKWLSTGNCYTTANQNELSDAKKVRLRDLVGVFIILGGGLLLSLAAAFAERLWIRRRESRVDITSNGAIPQLVSLIVNFCFHD